MQHFLGRVADMHELAISHPKPEVQELARNWTVTAVNHSQKKGKKKEKKSKSGMVGIGESDFFGSPSFNLKAGAMALSLHDVPYAKLKTVSPDAVRRIFLLLFFLFVTARLMVEVMMLQFVL